jgi:crotonobetainyl-CoA:carnitine CoA-transferase CaiB-like acyl-CoA transferase
MGNSSLQVAPHGCYAAAGEDEWITIVARTDAQWDALRAELASGGELDGPMFATLQSRLEHRHELDEAIAGLTRSHDKHELFLALQAAGVAAAPVMTPPDLLADAHLAERGFFQPMAREHVGTHLYPARFMEMSRTPSRFDRPAPTLGQHNAEVLSSWLGLDSDDLEELERTKVIGTTPVFS